MYFFSIGVAHEFISIIFAGSCTRPYKKSHINKSIC